VHYLKYQAGSLSATGLRGSVNIFCSVQDKIASGTVPVAAVSEAMDHCVGPTAAGGGRELKEAAASAPAGSFAGAQHCGSIQIASGIHNQAGNWVSGWPVVERMEHTLMPAALRVG
jgi:hypothetical protein